MGYSQENGYVPSAFNDLVDSFRAYINSEFATTYTAENFIGTNHYKFFYTLAQKVQENETKTAEIFTKLQQYYIQVNAKISRPVNTNPGIIEKMAAEGYTASVKKITNTDAGKIYICVDTDDGADDYATVKAAICLLISQITVGGGVTQGTETEAIVLSNGQSFDYKFNLPNRIPVLLKLTTTLSENNQVVVGDPDETKQLLLTNIQAKYKLGKNFEPQTYFSIADAPWCSQVLLEWSDDDGSNWHSTVYDAAYDDLFEISLENITLVEA